MHDSQSKGIVAALSSTRHVQVHWVSATLRSSLWCWMLRTAARLLPPDFLYWLLPISYHLSPWPDSEPDIVIGAGGDTVFMLGALSARHNAPSLFSGTTKRYTRKFLDCVFTVVPDPAKHNVVLLLPPVAISDLSRLKVTTPEKPLTGCVLIGGDGAGCVFVDSDWQRLANWMSGLGYDVRWLLSTSRRTGVEHETKLKAMLRGNTVALERSVWWADNPEQVMDEFLHDCDFIVCTQDSLSMLAEAMYTGKPVYSFAPKHCQMTETDATAIAGYIEQGFLKPVEHAQHIVIEHEPKPRSGTTYAQIDRAIGAAQERRERANADPKSWGKKLQRLIEAVPQSIGLEK
ncbi:mitochondrial fission ELM1 family protein [Gammaproteobacteria bacterium]|nr:mitochondrial fission ELM1 family protein [Gammaproteobacteria bacterium]